MNTIIYYFLEYNLIFVLFIIMKIGENINIVYNFKILRLKTHFNKHYIILFQNNVKNPVSQGYGISERYNKMVHVLKKNFEYYGIVYN